MRTHLRTRRPALAICALAALGLAACGGSPTDPTYSDLTGIWEGDLEGSDVPTHLSLSLVQESADSISGSGELRLSGEPAQALDVGPGIIRDGGLTLYLAQARTGAVTMTLSGSFSPRRDEILGTFTDQARKRYWSVWMIRQ